LESSTIFARLAFRAAILRLATALLRTRYSSASSIFTRLNGRIGTSYDRERHYVPNLADAPHRRPTRPLFTQVPGKIGFSEVQRSKRLVGHTRPHSRAAWHNPFGVEAGLSSSVRHTDM
jgi:hypothetical protein